MDEIYSAVEHYHMVLSELQESGFIWGYYEIAHANVKRLARLLRRFGEPVYWDKVPFTPELITVALAYTVNMVSD